LVDGVGIYDHVLPNLLQQPIDAHDLAGVFRKAEQQAHTAGLELDDNTIARDFVSCRVDPIVADTQERWTVCL